MMSDQQTLILDNGAYQIKAGYSGVVGGSASANEPRIFPNSIVKSKHDRKRVYIADELEECTDRSSLYFDSPFERGYLMNWNVQLQIWDRLFGKGLLDVEFPDTRLLLTDVTALAPAVRDSSAEIIFERYLFGAYTRTSAHSSLQGINDCCLVVDVGHSFTHVVPFLGGAIVGEAVVRIDVGGKALTNQLKDWVSYRQLNVLEETYMVNQCKEDACFVSSDFERDIHKCRLRNSPDSLVRDYLLPDYANLHRGVLQPVGSSASVAASQRLRLGVERIATPEILFHPSDIEIGQMGVVEAIHHSLLNSPEGLRFGLLQNVVLIGGSTLFPGFVERVEAELRSLTDDLMGFKVHWSNDAVCKAWRCAAELTAPSQGPNPLEKRFVTKAEYDENGASICTKRFHNYLK